MAHPAAGSLSRRSARVWRWGNSGGDEPRILCCSPHLLYIWHCATGAHQPSIGLGVPDQDASQGPSSPLGQLVEINTNKIVNLTHHVNEMMWTDNKYMQFRNEQRETLYLIFIRQPVTRPIEQQLPINTKKRTIADQSSNIYGGANIHRLVSPGDGGE